MKIGINARFLIDGKLEGIGWFCHEVIRRMVEWHPEHEYYLFFDRPFSQKFIFNNSVRGIVINPPARHPLLWYWWFEHSIPNAIQKFKIDIFISMDGYASLNLKISQHIVIHDLAYLHFPQHINWLTRKYYEYFVPKFLNVADKIYANSQATKDDVIRSLNINSNKIDLCFSGCKEMFTPLNEFNKKNNRIKYSYGNPYFLFVGALHPRKNVHGLIKAFSEFKKSDSKEFNLIIVGRKAWLADEVEKAFNESSYKENIIFLDNINNEELALITASAFAAIAPSFLEGFGVPALEALQCDIPVLCSNTFSLPEIAGPGAILFDPHNINSIRNAMVEIVNDSNILNRIELGRLHRTNFSWDLTAKVMCEGIFEIKYRKH